MLSPQTMLFLLGLLGVSPAEGFISSSQGRVGWVGSAPVMRSALMYKATDENPQDNDQSSSVEYYFQNDDQRFAALKQFLSQESGARLARLAVAFSPPEQGITLQDIQQVEVISIDEEQIDIQAILCGSDGCVSLSIPVSFPASCFGSEDVEGCIVSNVGALDVNASDVLMKQKWEGANGEETMAEARLMEFLLRSDNLNTPEWWIYADDQNLASECSVFRDLLNQSDFAVDLQKIAQKVLEMTYSGKYRVERAVVALVGPAGILLRTAVSDSATDPKETFESSDWSIGELPMAFSEQAQDAESLRALVLNAMASVQY
jgi:hypothetical protein